MQPNSFDPNGQPQDPQPTPTPTPDPLQPDPQPASFSDPAPTPANPFFASSDPTPVAPPAPATTPEPQAPAYPADPLQTQAPVQQPVAPPITQSPVAIDGPKPKNTKLLLILIAAGGLLFSGLALGAFFLFSNMNSNGESPIDTVTGSITGPKETMDRTDGTLDLSDTVNGTADIDNQNVNASLNQQVNLKNGLSLMVTKVERNFTAFNEDFISVADDEEVVAVTLVAGSRNTDGNGVVTSALELATPSDPGARPEFVSSLAEVENKFDTGSGLDQNQQVSGRLLYVVKKGEEPVSFHYSAKYKNYSTDEEVAIVVTIALK